MSSIVAVAGGTGKLGRAIVETLVGSGKFQVHILAREASGTKAKELGTSVISADYSNVESIVKALEENKIDTVISTLGSTFGTEPELALIEAASKSTATKRYIPSTWGLRYTPEVATIMPSAKSKITLVTALQGTNLEYTTVINGFFLDYYVIPHVKSYLFGITLAIDIANKAAAIPGSGNVPGVFTYSFDIARFIVALLGEPTWDKESYIIGDKVTFNEFLAIAEEARGSKFNTTYDSLDTLKSYKVTELPAHPGSYAFFPKERLQGMCATFGILFEEGVFDFKPEKSLNDQFPDIKTRKVKDLVQEAWGGR
ncbi:NAD(P)-binding protein [Lophiostoma macrostomum CBS 122681]|uniref:NAD(P)-binding protein n=1 Tax=Lophiostoma macrostomum CBS 122681 TaxID=1314788 RepID=A0A6A6SNV8_9PLEO|nr:NAD(P)-binding protein [Lophiostoma macrostomum CBS 122681]